MFKGFGSRCRGWEHCDFETVLPHNAEHLVAFSISGLLFSIGYRSRPLLVPLAGVGFVAALGQLVFLGDTEVFKKIVDGTFEAARFGVMDIALPLAGVMTLWMVDATHGEPCLG